MSYQLCEKVRNLEPYEPISGTYKIRLDANESFYSMPQEILDEIKNIIQNTSFNRYPDPCAKELIRTFADFYDIDPEYVTAGNGSDELISVITTNLLQKNSKVLVIEPDFSMYRFYATLCENEVIAVQKNENFCIDIDMVIRTANENKVDMIIFSNPCNPTGQGVSCDEIRRLIANVSALVILDEAYMDFWNQPLLKEAANYDNLIILKTASKCIGSAAIRLGFAIANKTITTALRAVKSPYNVNTLTQNIGTCIFSHKTLLQERRTEIIANKNKLYKAISELCQKYNAPIRIFETCTNFVYITGELSKSIFDFMLSNGIAIRCFKNNALRITAGSTEENAEFIFTLEKFFANQTEKM